MIGMIARLGDDPDVGKLVEQLRCKSGALARRDEGIEAA